MEKYIENIDSIGNLIEKTVSIIDNRKGKEPELKIPSIPALEHMLWGFKKKKLYIIGARTAHGKSSLMLQLAYDFSLQGKIVHFHSFEMTKEVCVERLISNRCRIDNYLLTKGTYSEFSNLVDKVELLKKEVSSLPLIFIESVGNSLPQLEELHCFLHNKPDVIFIDYGNLVAEQQFKSKKQTYDEYIEGLRAIAIRKDICVVMAAQINRNVSRTENGKCREPELSDFKETGKNEEVADCALLLYWADSEKPEYLIKVAKNRDGRTGRIPCKYTACMSLIEEDSQKIQEIKERVKNGKTKEGAGEGNRLSGDRRNIFPYPD